MTTFNNIEQTYRGPITQYKSINGMVTGIIDVDIELHAGANYITVQAIDNAGNVSEESEELIITLDQDEMLENYVRKSSDDRFSHATIRRELYEGQLNSYSINSTIDEINVEKDKQAIILNAIKDVSDDNIFTHPININPSSDISIEKKIDHILDQLSNTADADNIIYEFDIAGTDSSSQYTTGQEYTDNNLKYRYLGYSDGGNHHIVFRPKGIQMSELTSGIAKATFVFYCYQTFNQSYLPIKSIKLEAANSFVYGVFFEWNDTNPLTPSLENTGSLAFTNATWASITDPYQSYREEDFEYDIYDGKVTRIELDVTEQIRYLAAGYTVHKNDTDNTVSVGLNGIRMSADDHSALSIITGVIDGIEGYPAPYILVERKQ